MFIVFLGFGVIGTILIILAFVLVGGWLLSTGPGTFFLIMFVFWIIWMVYWHTKGKYKSAARRAEQEELHERARQENANSKKWGV